MLKSLKVEAVKMYATVRSGAFFIAWKNHGAYTPLMSGIVLYFYVWSRNRSTPQAFQLLALNALAMGIWAERFAGLIVSTILFRLRAGVCAFEKWCAQFVGDDGKEELPGIKLER